jgi:ATP-dependent Lon protease
VLLPAGNERELTEMHAAIKDHLNFVPVSRMEEVLKQVLLPAPRARRSQA